MSRKKGRGAPQPHRGGNSTGGSAYVSVFCAGTHDSPHDKYRIGTFIPEEHDGAVVWHALVGSYFDPAHRGSIAIRGRVSQWLDGDQWVNSKKGEHDRDLFTSTSFRVRWNLACGICGTGRVVRRPSDLYEAFTVLAMAGIKEVELAHLIHARRHAENTSSR